MSSSTDNRVILVTGANKGIGYEAVKFLSQHLPSTTIVLASRSTDNGRSAIEKMKSSAPTYLFDNVKVVALDVTDPSSIGQAAAHVKADHGRVDVLICNSGISNVNGDGMSTGIFDVNVTGVKNCVDAFLPVIPQGGQVVVVSSEVGSWAMHELAGPLQKQLNNPAALSFTDIEALMKDWAKASEKEPTQNHWPAQEKTFGAYGISKALVTGYSRALALQRPEIKIILVTPGYCATDLNYHSGPRPASKGGESIVWPVLHADQAKTGTFWLDGEEYPWIEQMPPHYAENAEALKKKMEADKK